MKNSGVKVNIFWGGCDDADRIMAQAIANEVEQFATPCLHTIKMLAQNPLLIYDGVPVFVLSEAMMVTPEARALICGVTFLPGHHYYYLTRGVRPAQLRARYPELGVIYENYSIVDELDLEPLLRDLQVFVQDIFPRLPRFGGLSGFWFGISYFVSGIAINIFVVLRQLTDYFFATTFLVPPILGIVIWRHLTPTWGPMLLASCAFSFGYRINDINPMDIWPWLGPKWRVAPDTASTFIKNGTIDKLRSDLMSVIGAGIGASASPTATLLLALVGGSIGEFIGRILDQREDAVLRSDLTRPVHPVSSKTSFLSNADLAVSLKGWSENRSYTARITLLVLSWFGIPSLVAMNHVTGAALAWSGCALIVGLVWPGLGSWLDRISRHRTARSNALTSDQLRRLEKIAPRLPLSSFGTPGLRNVDLSDFDISERLRVSQWLTLLSAPTAPLLLRPLLTHRDLVMISYSWHDDPNIGVSTRLASTLDVAGIEYFLDRQNVPSRFANWRSHVGAAIRLCTHLFLIVSPEIAQGEIIKREIESIFHLWVMNLLPSVICVVEPEIAQMLLNDKTIFFDLRFMLKCCPCLSFEEAGDPVLVGALIRQRRRHGRLHDWVNLLTPRAAFSRCIRSLLIT